jgi:hypothetical protein
MNDRVMKMLLRQYSTQYCSDVVGMDRHCEENLLFYMATLPSSSSGEHSKK